MALQNLKQPHQSATALAGTWKLGAGRAITLEPRETGLLRIAHGSVWATGDGPHGGALNNQGDRFLQVGDQLWLRPGGCWRSWPAWRGAGWAASGRPGRIAPSMRIRAPAGPRAP